MISEIGNNPCTMENSEYRCDTPNERGRGVVKLLLSILTILFLMFYALPVMMPYLGLAPIAEFIEERDINANMYFYTEVEEFSEANINMDNTWAYTPIGPNN